MTHSYLQSSFINGDRQFEATENSETRQLRAMSPLPTFQPYLCGVADATETVEWDIGTDTSFYSFWVYYPGAPAGTITLTVLDKDGNTTASLVVNTSNSGEKFENAWKYDFSGTFSIGKGSKIRLTPSSAISSVAAYGEPCLHFDPKYGANLA